MKVFCQLGIGNRIATIAAAIAKWENIVFHWSQNRDLPNPIHDVFPRGFRGVEFVNVPSGNPSTGIDGKMGYDYHESADYVEAMRWLSGSAFQPVDFAIHGRFYRNKDADPIALVDKLPPDARRVFVMSDCHRGAIARELRRRGIIPIIPQSREMTHDFDRECADMLPFLCDWKTLCQASFVVTNCEESSALHPLRQSGAEIVAL